MCSRVVCLALLFTIFSCKETPPEPPKAATLSLRVEDASCTEAWLKASTTETPATVRLLRDGQRTSDFRLLTSDSLLLDEGLLPRHTYTYQLQKLSADSSVAETSASVQLTTMDTTSHNFTWQIDTLGDGSSSVLYDVAVINDTLAYAVGEMYLRDSTGGIDPQAWNAAKWNGQRWELKRIPFIGPCSAVLYSPLKAILAFSATDILVTNGGSIVRYDGANAIMDCRMNSLLTGAINKIWASSPQTVYAVGNAGTIVYYNGNTWQRVESGTRANINDVWGVGPVANQSLLLAVASNRYSTGEKKLLRLGGSGFVDTLGWSPARRSLTVWFNSARKIFVGGDGVLVGEPGRWREVLTIPPNTTTRIRGTGSNNVWAVGAFGLCCHFNGMTWRSYPEVGLSFGSYEGLATSGQLMIAVGEQGNRAIALVSYEH